MNETIAFIVLGIVILVQTVERYFYAKDMNQKLQDSMKAVMSRNIGEYLAATKPQEKSNNAPPDNDLVDLSSLDDKKYSEVIAKM